MVIELRILVDGDQEGVRVTGKGIRDRLSDPRYRLGNNRLALALVGRASNTPSLSFFLPCVYSSTFPLLLERLSSWRPRSASATTAWRLRLLGVPATRPPVFFPAMRLFLYFSSTFRASVFVASSVRGLRRLHRGARCDARQIAQPLFNVTHQNERGATIL
jgi:hypothetical protein